MAACARSNTGPSAEETAQRRWLAASESLRTVQDVRDRLFRTDPAWADQSIPNLIVSVETMAATATAELDAAAKAVVLLPEGSTKSNYEDAIAGGREAVEKSRAVVPLLRALPALWKQSAQIDQELKASRDQANASVSEGNEGDYKESLTAARGAIAAAERAETAFANLEEALGPLASFDTEGGRAKVAKAVAAQRALAQATLDVAEAGSGGGSGYNAAVERYKRAATAANAAPDVVEALGSRTTRSWATRTLDAAKVSIDSANASYAKITKLSSGV